MEKIYKVERISDFIPKAPDNTYQDKGWLGYGDWLEVTATLQIRIDSTLILEDAKAFAQALKLKNYSQWKVSRW